MAKPTYLDFKHISNYAYAIEAARKADLPLDHPEYPKPPEGFSNFTLDDNGGFSIGEILASADVTHEQLKELGMQPVMLINGDGVAVLGFSGTQPGDLSDLKADAQIAQNQTPEQMEIAADIGEAFADAAREAGFEPMTTGHSLGGDVV